VLGRRKLKVSQSLFNICFLFAVFTVAVFADGCLATWIIKAQQCMRLPDEDPNKAVSSCTAALGSGKLSTHDIAAAYSARGVAYINLKKSQMALEDFNRSISVEPHAEAFNSRGIAYDMLGDYTHALQDYDEAIRLEPGNAPSYNNRGLVYSEKGDEEKAILDFDKAISLKPDYAEAITNRAGTYLLNGEYDKAIQDWTTDLPLEHNSPAVLHDRALAYNGKKDYPRALDDLTRAVDKMPNGAELYYARAATYFNLGKFDLAILDCRKAISLPPTDLYPVIWCYMMTARTRAGADVRDLKHSLEWRDTPWPTPVIRTLAGQMTPEELLRAAKLEGKTSVCEAYFYLGEDALIHNRPRDAKTLFQKAVLSGSLNTLEYFSARAELDRMAQIQSR
jgi:tetratricopeptide (TPR) repeat protein